MGAIAGGVVGGVVVIGLLAVLFLFCRRRRHVDRIDHAPPNAATLVDDGNQYVAPTSAWNPNSRTALTSPSHISSNPSAAHPIGYDPYAESSRPTQTSMPSSSSYPRSQGQTFAASNPDPNSESIFPVPMRRGSTEKTRKGEITIQLEDREQQLAALQSRRTIRHAPSMSETTGGSSTGGSEAVLESQVQSLQQEVARLREMMETMGEEAPPQYQG